MTASSTFTCCLLFLTTILVTSPITAQRGKTMSSSIANSATVKQYGQGLIGYLNEATFLVRKGQMQNALIEIEKALGQQPDWIPALVQRAEILNLMGRKEEADAEIKRAQRLNRITTDVLMSYRMASPIRYQALYPQAWINQEYEILTPDILTGEVNEPALEHLALDYFDIQYNQILLTPDTTAIGLLLRDMVNSRVNDAPIYLADYLGQATTSDPLRNMFEGNVQLLNRQLERALFYYTMAIEQGGEFWPELYYNRGLTLIYMNRYPAGCQNLITSSERGFRPATVLLANLCNF